jgi:hypothetical protein
MTNPKPYEYFWYPGRDPISGTLNPEADIVNPDFHNK